MKFVMILGSLLLYLEVAEWDGYRPPTREECKQGEQAWPPCEALPTNKKEDKQKEQKH